MPYIGRAELEECQNGPGGGTVTSVNVVGGTGILSIGGPVTTNGVITISVDQPALNLNLFGNILGVPKGGTGLSTVNQNSILFGNGTSPLGTVIAPAIPNTFLRWNGVSFDWTTAGAGSGTVTSVGLTAASNKVAITGTSPITTSGAFTVDINEANLSLNNIGGVLSVAKGGTGNSTFAAGSIPVGTGTSPLASIAAPSVNDTYLNWNAGVFSWQPVLAGAFVQITGDTMTGDLIMSNNAIIQGSNGSASAPSFSFAGMPNLGMYSAVANEMSFASAGSQKLAINNTQITLYENMAFNTGTDAVIDVTNSNNVLNINGVGSLGIPVGTDAQRPSSPNIGMIRVSTDHNRFEGYVNNMWFPFTGEPLIPDGIVANDVYTIPAGYHMIAAEDFLVAGTLILNGRLLLI